MSLKSLSSQSRINIIKIKYDNETIKFNLSEELSINPNKIKKQLEEQPSYYGFLLLLRTRLLTIKEDKEREAEKTYSNIYKAYSEKINPKTNRAYSDKAAEKLVEGSTKYNEARKEAIQAKQDYNLINSCVIAFEQRATLMQTIAANIRSEK